MVQDRVRSIGLFLAIFLMAYTIVATTIFDPILTEPLACDRMSERQGGIFIANFFVSYIEAKKNISELERQNPNETYVMPVVFQSPAYASYFLCGPALPDSGAVARLMSWQGWLFLGHFVVLGAYMANSEHMKPYQAAFQCLWSLLCIMVGISFNIALGGVTDEFNNRTMLNLVVTVNAMVILISFLSMAVFSCRCFRGTRLRFQSYYAKKREMMEAHVRGRLVAAGAVIEAARLAHSKSWVNLSKTKVRLALEFAASGDHAPAGKVAQAKIWIARRVLYALGPSLVVEGPSVRWYLHRTGYFQFPLRFWACVFLLMFAWLLFVMATRTAARYLTSWTNLLTRFLVAFDLLVDAGVIQPSAPGFFGMVSTFSGIDAFDLEYVNLVLQFLPVVARLPISTISTVIRVVNIVFWLAPLAGVLAMAGVMIRNGVHMRRDILQAREFGWRSLLSMPTQSVNYATQNAANYVGLQVAVILLSTVFIALIAAAALGLVFLVVFKVFRISLSPRSFFRVDLLLKTLGPILVTRQIALLLCRYYATDKVGEIKRLRIFCLLDFLLFFLNILGGWAVALVRLIAAVIRVFLNFPRLHYPVTPTHWHDPGYTAYLAAIRISASVFNNPIAVTFHTTLVATVSARRTLVPIVVPRVGVAKYRCITAEADHSAAARRRMVRNRLWLWITLIGNPSLRAMRR
jgi:hypothetical protein